MKSYYLVKIISVMVWVFIVLVYISLVDDLLSYFYS